MGKLHIYLIICSVLCVLCLSENNGHHEQDKYNKGVPEEGCTGQDGEDTCEEEIRRAQVTAAPGRVHHLEESEGSGDIPVVHLGFVACGDRLEEALVMIKSAVFLTKGFLHFHIFADDDLTPRFKNTLSEWPDVREGRVMFDMYPISYPRGDTETWVKMFSPCASLRLFFPEILPADLDSILYIDTDVLFMRSAAELWEKFRSFNSTQMAALAPEHEQASISWYKRFSQTPYYPPLGLNSGVMLMNLTLMRRNKWVDHIMEYYGKHRYDLIWKDQDLINIYFHFHPDEIFVIPCEWNYRSDHCLYMDMCQTATQQGAAILHGNRAAFHDSKHPPFKTIYQVFKDHGFGEHLESLYNKVLSNMDNIQREKCGNFQSAFTQSLKAMLALT